MREIVTEIEIDASPQKVWDFLTEFSAWEDWNSTIYASSGTSGPGARLDITMKNRKGGAGPRYSPVISEWDPPHKFRWRAKMGFAFLFTNDKEVTLAPQGAGTKLVHKELFSGLFVNLFWNKMKSGVPPILVTMNQDLKNQVEKHPK